MHILVTGGAGFIGSHTCVELLESGYKVTVIDNLSNSSQKSLNRVQKISSRSLTFHQIDLLDQPSLEHVFSSNSFDAVIHFAGLKAVGESVQKPLDYYQNNLTGTINLLQAMTRHKIKNLVFSSSATVYGLSDQVPFTEDSPLSATNPYARTKLFIEHILTDLQISHPGWNIIILRYFNPIGAHPSGLIGEDPHGIPNNLLPFISQVAVGKLDKLTVFGNDYPTPDGTGIRDYIHVVDLAIGHVKALEKLYTSPGLAVYNLGTGKGSSVLEVISAFEKASGKTIPYQFAPRRAGDVAISFADCSKAQKELGWKATKTLEDMCTDTWRWQSQNPQGY